MTNVRVLDGTAARDDRIVGQLIDLINRVYDKAEEGMWRDGATRTTAEELAELIAAGEIVVAEQGDEMVGVVRVHDVADDASEFGVLAAAPEHRGIGIGRALLDFAEQRSRERGQRVMQLEILIPREWDHPSKEFLKAWYGRRGYELVRTGSFADAYPKLAPMLATPCDLTVWQKPLD
jgi:GNAT superfamily N-acetyltransferase